MYKKFFITENLASGNPPSPSFSRMFVNDAYEVSTYMRDAFSVNRVQIIMPNRSTA